MAIYDYFRLRKSGMSLIEVMVALVILGLTSAALMGLFLAGSRNTVVARHDVEAANVAQEILEQVKAIPEDQLGTAQSGTATTIQLETGASDANGCYNGMTIAITGGTGAGQVRKIADYNGATRTATVEGAWDTIPDTTTTYAIFKGVDTGYAYQVTVAPNGNLATVTVTVTYQATGNRQREVSLTSERLRR
ncbi:MAG TPA: prepilin-type N-terminal cleavage/methylation domain-containing protein [Syntrophomonadaceae bacterium]|nr:prepilin-type N-terminal cleavage/methylation domain-containing protein [Syntrophomonadaceae bacterium]